MHFRWLWVIILSLGWVSCTEAGFRPKVQVSGERGGAALKVNGMVVLRLRTPNAGLSPVERIRIAAGRLQAWIAHGGNPSALGIKGQGSTVWVMTGSARLVAATRQEARMARTTPAGLASVWVRSLRHGLSLPGLTASPGEVLIPLGESRAVELGGVAQGPIRLDADPSIAEAQAASSGRAITLKGIAVGRYKLALERERARASVWVTVRKYAGRLMGMPHAEVTGMPASQEALTEAVETALYRSVELESGAKLSLEGRLKLPKALMPGERAEAVAGIRIDGPGYIPLGGPTKVMVVNRALSVKETTLLMFSNDPERLPRTQNLFWGELPLDQPARLMYHHQNGTGAPVQLALDLLNRGSEPAQVAILASPAPATRDTVLVGHRAAARFLKDLATRSGYITEVPAGGVLRLVGQRLETDRTGSGLFEFRQLTGLPMWVRVAAEPPGQPAPRVPQTVSVNSQQLFPNPFKTVEAEYKVGQPWTFIRLGKYAIPGHESDHQLAGNYGVLYQIRVKLENPTSEKKAVNVLFEPSAGAARGVFLIDGRFVQTNHLQPPTEALLTQVELAPRQVRSLSIQTVPLAGSAYPATIIVR